MIKFNSFSKQTKAFTLKKEHFYTLLRNVSLKSLKNIQKTNSDVNYKMPSDLRLCSPLAGVHEAGVFGGLSLYNKVNIHKNNDKIESGMDSKNKLFPFGERNRWKTSIRLPDGSIKVTDSFESKLWRLRTAVHSWVDSMQLYSDNYDLKMITLTYAKAEDWKANDIKNFCSWLRRYCGDSLISYAWVAELQERGAVHYHLTAYFKKGFSVPFPDKPTGRKNFVPWAFGYSRIEKAKNPAYLVTYLGKEHQKDFHRFPLGARSFSIWANSEYEKISDFVIGYKKFLLAPQWIQQHCTSDYINTSADVDLNPVFTEFKKRCKGDMDSFNKYILKTADFIKVKTCLKRLPSVWFLDDVPIKDVLESHLNSLGIYKVKNSYKVQLPRRFIRSDAHYKELNLKDCPLDFLDFCGLTKDSGGWLFEDELLQTPCVLDSVSKSDASTWVDELMSKIPRSKPEYKGPNPSVRLYGLISK